jgi:hypothetical protein
MAGILSRCGYGVAESAMNSAGRPIVADQREVSPALGRSGKCAAVAF